MKFDQIVDKGNMNKVIYISFLLLALLGCNANVEVKKLNDTPENVPQTVPETVPEIVPGPDLDIIAFRDSMSKGQGENSSTEIEPIDCSLTGNFTLLKLLNLSSKIAFGISATPAFTCGECTLLVKCIPGELVNLRSYDAGDNLLYDVDYFCGQDGEIPLTDKYGTGYMKVQAMVNRETETEFLNCTDVVR